MNYPFFSEMFGIKVIVETHAFRKYNESFARQGTFNGLIDVMQEFVKKVEYISKNRTDLSYEYRD